MRFIHTADWHLGNSMYQMDRSQEMDSFFSWLKDQIIQKEADALVVAGDVFDTVNPPVEARKKYFSFLSSLMETCCRSVIITGGNHDSGALLDAPAEILKELNVNVTGCLGDRTIDDMIFELYDRTGQVCGICAAIPFLRELDLRHFKERAVTREIASIQGKDRTSEAEATSGVPAADASDCTSGSGNTLCSGKGSEEETSLSDAYRLIYEEAWKAADKLRGERNIPIIATGHLYAADLEGRLAGVEPSVKKSDDGVRSIDIVGKLGSIPPSVFHSGFDYVALGHIHYTTMVARNPKIRYSGSPFVLGFDEAQIPHHVLHVSCEMGEVPTVDKLEVPPVLHFLRVSGTCDELAGRLMELKASAPENLYVEVCYKAELGLNIHEELEPILKDAPFTVADWKVLRQENREEAQVYEDTFEGAGQLDEEDIFRLLLQRKSGYGEGSTELEECFKELYPLFHQVSEDVKRGDA